MPDAAQWDEVIKVFDLNEKDSDLNLNVNMNSFTQMGVCYFSKSLK